jgi:hypothetical protein
VAEVTQHPAGETAQGPRVGDFLLTGIKAQGIVSWAIKAGSFLRRFEAPYRRFSHAALVIDEDGTLAEALGNGVVRSPLTKYEAANYVLVRTGVQEPDRGQILEFANAVLEAKTRYGFWTIVGLGLYCLAGAQICIQRAGTAICSGFVSDALTRAGYVWPRPPFAMMPADLARYFEVRQAPGPAAGAPQAAHPQSTG